MRRARVLKSESNELVLVDEIENGKHHNINLRYNRFKPTLLPELSVLDSGDEGQTIVLSFNDGDWYICSEDLDSRIDCLDCDGELRRVDRDLVSLGCQEIVRIKQKHGEIIDTAALIEIVSQSKFELNLFSFEQAFERQGKGLGAFQLPERFHGTPYPHQLTGIKWMWDTFSAGLGFVLGDEMGLGKTYQTIALFCKYKETSSDKPCAVVCPASLQLNWIQEINQFAPHLQICLHRGPHRSGLASKLSKFDVVILSYGVLVSPLDRRLISEVDWGIVALDEAQAIKNPDAQRALASKSINSEGRIAITGTPLENTVQDLWSIFDFCAPGLLGNLDQFNAIFSDDIASARRLEMLTKPLLLRRRIRAVREDLPEILTYEHVVEMSPSEQLAYDQFQDRHENTPLLAKLQLERQFCCLPELVSPQASTKPTTKLLRLIDILDSVSQTGEKAVIFTSFQRVLDHIDCSMRYLGSSSDDILYIDGRNSSVAVDVISEFERRDGFNVMCLNPKAAEWA